MNRFRTAPGRPDTRPDEVHPSPPPRHIDYPEVYPAVAKAPRKSCLAALGPNFDRLKRPFSAASALRSRHATP